MAITAAMRTQVVQLYAALFGRAPEADGLGYWVQQMNSGKTFAQVAQAMYTVDAARAYYPSFYTNEEIITKFYTNVLGRTPDTAGKDYWVGKLNAAGATPGAVIADMITAVVSYKDTDADALKSQALFNNKVAVGEYYAVTLVGNDVTFAKTLFTGVTDSTATVDAAKATADLAVNPPVTGQTYTLTTGADTPTGTTADDVFVGTETTLSSADVLKGGSGNDTLRVANSGAAKTFSGFELQSIETVQVTADGTGATAFDVTGTVGVTKIVNSGSSQDLTFTGLKAIPTNGLEVTGVTGGNTIVTFESDAVAGAADSLKVALNGAKTIANGAVGTLTANGIESFAVTTSGAASNLTAIASTTMTAMTVAGDKSLTLGGVTFSDNVNVNTLNASGLTGTAALNVTIAANTATLDVAVTGGAGDDRADFSTGFDTKDAFTGGAGRDTLALTQAVASAQAAATGGSVSGVEILEITNGGTGTISMDNFGGVDTVYYSGLTGGTALTGNVTVSNAVTGITVRDNVDAAAQNVTVTLKANGTTDVANFAFDKVGAADNIGTLSAAEFETVNITVADDAAVLDTGSLTIANATLTAATKVTLAGNANVTITASTNPATAVLGTFDASTLTGKVTVSGTNLRAAGATVTLGSGDDTFNLGTAAGADTFDLTKGGKDKIVYTTVAQSSATGTDTIKGFTSGNDIIDLTAAALLGGGTNGAGVADATQFVGNKATFGEAQGALAGTGSNTQSAVFDQSTSILWVDSDKNGTLDANDFRIKLEGVTALTAADLGLAAAAGASITVTAASANVTTTLKDKATASSTAFNDTIFSTIANLTGTTIDGATGNDTLTLTDSGVVGALPATITNVETLVLNGTAANTGVAFNNAGVFKNVTGSSNADTIAATLDLVEGGTISLGAGNDVITALGPVEVAGGGADTSVKVSVDMGAGDDAVTTIAGFETWTADTVLNGGDGTDTLTLVTASVLGAGSVSGFENLTTGATASMKVAQYNSFTGTVTNGGAITFTDGGTLTLKVAGNFNLGNAANTVTVGTGATGTLTGGTAADSFSGTSVQILATTAIAGGAGAGDKVTIDLNGAASAHNGGTDAISGVETLVFTNSGASAVLNLTATDAYGATTFDMSALTSNTTFVGTGLTTATSIKFGTGNETITNLNAGAAAMTVDFGGGNATVTDFTDSGTTHSANTNNVTLKFGTAAGTQAVTFAATTEKFLTGDVFDFATNVVSVILGAADGTKGVAGGVGQIFIDDQGADIVITFDADGNRTFSAGDVQITLVGQATLTGGIDASGNFLVS